MYLLPLFFCLLFCLLYNFVGHKYSSKGSVFINVFSILISLLLSFFLFYEVCILHVNSSITLLPWMYLGNNCLLFVLFAFFIANINSVEYMLYDAHKIILFSYLSLLFSCLLLLFPCNSIYFNNIYLYTDHTFKYLIDLYKFLSLVTYDFKCYFIYYKESLFFILFNDFFLIINIYLKKNILFFIYTLISLFLILAYIFKSCLNIWLCEKTQTPVYYFKKSNRFIRYKLLNNSIRYYNSSNKKQVISLYDVFYDDCLSYKKLNKEEQVLDFKICSDILEKTIFLSYKTGTNYKNVKIVQQNDVFYYNCNNQFYIGAFGYVLKKRLFFYLNKKKIYYNQFFFILSDNCISDNKIQVYCTFFFSKNLLTNCKWEEIKVTLIKEQLLSPPHIEVLKLLKDLKNFNKWVIT